MSTDLRQRRDGSKGPDPLARKTHGGEEPRDGSPPAVSGSHRGSAPAPSPFHRCGGCGATYTRAQWQRLHHCGTQLYEYHDGGADEMLEHRNCPCGSTMAVDLYATGDATRPTCEPRHPELLKTLERAQQAGDHELADRLLKELDEKNRRDD